MVLVSEILSLVYGITVVGLTVVWATPACICLGWFIGDRLRGKSWHLPAWKLPTSWIDRLLLACVVFIVILTAIVAWYAPVQTYDSLTYHMSRVAHWAQNQSLKPFATGIERQVWMSPGAEIAILQTYVLAHGDRFANFVEWFAMVVSLIGASWVAKRLGAGEVGQLLAAVFAATLPMGIAQASSTMTDYVVAMWMICVAMESLTLAKRPNNNFATLLAVLAASMAILTKPTAISYLIPFCVFISYVLVRRRSFKVFMAWAVLAIVILLAVNAGYFGRNMQVYGHPYGSSLSKSRMLNEVFNVRMLLSNTLRNASMHAGTPFEDFNRSVYVLIAKVHVKIGVDLNDRQISYDQNFGIRRPSTSETFATNPLHALLILIFTLVLFIRARRESKDLMLYVLFSALTWVVFSGMFKVTVFGSRYHLPFFILFAPVVGYALVRFIRPFPARVVGIILVVSCWSWLTGIKTRPLISTEKEASILDESRVSLYFALAQGLEDPYREITDRINDEQCMDVGLMLSGNGAEYPFWVLMGAPNDALQLEWIVSDTPSERYIDADFEPCAVICGRCPAEWEDFHGMPVVFNDVGFRLFLRERD
jgi:hypothetical protein